MWRPPPPFLLSFRASFGPGLSVYSSVVAAVFAVWADGGPLKASSNCVKSSNHRIEKCVGWIRNLCSCVQKQNIYTQIIFFMSEITEIIYFNKVECNSFLSFYRNNNVLHVRKATITWRLIGFSHPANITIKTRGHKHPNICHFNKVCGSTSGNSSRIPAARTLLLTSIKFSITHN